MPEVPCPEGCGRTFKTKSAAHAHAYYCKAKGGEHIKMEHREEATVTEESKEADLAKALQEGLQGIQSTLGKVETDVGDFCSKFPELCQRVESIEKGLSTPRVESGTEEWKGRRRADLDHMLFGDCPECSPIRDEVLKAKGKALAALGAEVEVEAKVEAEEPETSPGYKPGSKWDQEKGLYVKQ